VTREEHPPGGPGLGRECRASLEPAAAGAPAGLPVCAPAARTADGAGRVRTVGALRRGRGRGTPRRTRGDRDRPAGLTDRLAGRTHRASTPDRHQRGPGRGPARTGPLALPLNVRARRTSKSGECQRLAPATFGGSREWSG